MGISLDASIIGGVNEAATRVLQTLMDGNTRFRSGNSIHHTYDRAEISSHATQQKPIACVISCSDSRVCPEIVFDQPLGALFVARVPGNVCCDSAKWTIDIAVTEFTVPLVVVVGHTRCLAVTQVLTGINRGEGGPLRLSVMAATLRVKDKTDPVTDAVRQNASMAIEQLTRESFALRGAIASGQTDCVAVLYDVMTGSAELISEP